METEDDGTDDRHTGGRWVDDCLMNGDYVKKTYRPRIGRFVVLMVGIVACSFTAGFSFVKKDWLAFVVSVLCAVQFVCMFFIDLRSCKVVWRSWNHGAPDVYEGMKMNERWYAK